MSRLITSCGLLLVMGLFFIANDAAAQSLPDLKPSHYGLANEVSHPLGNVVLSIGSSAVFGYPYRVQLSVNQGSYTTSGAIPVLFQVDTNNDGKVDQKGSAKYYTGSLNKISEVYSFTALPLGTVRIMGCIDKNLTGSGIVSEVDEQNNCTDWNTVTVSCGAGMVENGTGGCQYYEKAIPSDTQALIGSFRHLYAPSVVTASGKKRMLTGGWLTDSDPNDFLAAINQKKDLTQVYGADKIFYSEEKNGAWTYPVLAFQKKGYHVNDPSVIAPPSSDGINRSQWLYLYYTGLDNRKAADSVDQIKNNVIGFASSVDGGKTWMDGGIKIGVTEGGDGAGAWAPSAVLSPDGKEIWVYYNTGTSDFSKPIVFRQRFALNGVSKIGSPTRIATKNLDSSYNALLNVDVSRTSSGFVLLANKSLDTVVRLVSADGLTWEADPLLQPVIIKAAPGTNSHILTPHLENSSDTSFKVYFGYGTGGESTSIQMWRFDGMPAIKVEACVPGLGKSTTDPNNSVICDAKASWSVTRTTNAYVVVTGSFPYTANGTFPNGFVLSRSLSGSNQLFWVTNGTYTATLYVNGTPPTNTSLGTGVMVAKTTFTIGQGVASSGSEQHLLSQIANVLQSIKSLLSKW